MKHCVTIYAVLFNDQVEILSVKYARGDWAFPGGHLEKGESWEESLRREIKEELDMEESQVELIAPLFIDNWYYEGKPYFGAFILGRLRSGDIRLSHEHSEYRWLNESEFRKVKPAYDSFFEIGDRAFARIREMNNRKVPNMTGSGL